MSTSRGTYEGSSARREPVGASRRSAATAPRGANGGPRRWRDPVAAPQGANGGDQSPTPAPRTSRRESPSPLRRQRAMTTEERGRRARRDTDQNSRRGLSGRLRGIVNKSSSTRRQGAQASHSPRGNRAPWARRDVKHSLQSLHDQCSFLKKEVSLLRNQNQEILKRNQQLEQCEKRLEDFQTRMTSLERAQEED